MKKNKIIYKGLIKAGKESVVDLGSYLPIGKIESDLPIEVLYKKINKWQKLENMHGNELVTARFISLIARQDTLVNVYLGHGFIANPVDSISDQFKRNSGWTGADGLFSFNTENGNDSHSQFPKTTTFVFGDTFVGEVAEDGSRIEPVLMPNNTLAYMQGNDYEHIEFKVNEIEGEVTGYFTPEESLHYKDGKERDVWFWLQDGVVIGDSLYVLPLVCEPDKTQPEGLQFKMDSVSMLKVNIENGRLNTSKQSQKRTNLLQQTDSKTFLYGNAIFANTVQAGSSNPDGYIYIYGYIKEGYVNKLMVAKVLEADFEDVSKWTYYNGTSFSDNLLDSKALLSHISCEMSISEIPFGEFKGKYIAVYQYDVNTNYLAYSIGETLVGPFTEPQIVYSTEETVRHYGNTTYTYNSKAHPHISKKGELLVSYNVNTYSLEHNYGFSDVYRPRFVSLKEAK
jgi:hypothetical protein